ncbi:hypothetical protein RJ639_028939 [Escallonia herrerae]|uniref:Trichome birefringence-like C-terminal domain-containing protein n=1 Tax=Escallonia herrerae TaxID=1293975 RepID=A0AA88X5E0_9ASTE|nr:hypothetical protein RJ639_028939 [Escallonia herrerae]
MKTPLPPLLPDAGKDKFNGRDFLWRFRGKSIMFVGDSLSLNQWQSLTCMLHIAVPHASYRLARSDSLSTFTFPVYNITVMFSRKPFLVDIVNETNGRALVLDSMQSGERWKGIDILIFSTWHRWLHTDRKQPWDFIKLANHTYKDMDRLVAFKIGLRTWARWVDSNVDPNKTNVFFQGVSPDHDKIWGELSSRGCQSQQRPLFGSRYPGGPHPAEAVLAKVLRKMSYPVLLLNTTTLSQLRIDGHPSSYGYGGQQGRDCSHWCLAGVPDTWNQLLYTALIQHQN